MDGLRAGFRVGNFEQQHRNAGWILVVAVLFSGR